MSRWRSRSIVCKFGAGQSTFPVGKWCALWEPVLRAQLTGGLSLPEGDFFQLLFNFFELILRRDCVCLRSDTKESQPVSNRGRFICKEGVTRPTFFNFDDPSSVLTGDPFIHADCRGLCAVVAYNAHLKQYAAWSKLEKKPLGSTNLYQAAILSFNYVTIRFAIICHFLLVIHSIGTEPLAISNHIWSWKY